MAKSRTSHLKSRKGCTNCKQRHVKCDEQGPPCANCLSRKTQSTCIYPNNTSKLSSHPSVQSSPLLESSSLVRKPAFFGSPPELSTLLQLELMHRWSTTTWMSFVVVPPDVSYMQTTVPRGGLEYRFLLNGIFATAALEIASTGHPRAARYARCAMEFYDASIGSFREQLAHVDSDNVPWVVLYSGMIAINSAALTNVAATQESLIEVTMEMFDLYIGTAVLVRDHRESLARSSYRDSMVSVVESFESAVPAKLDDETEEAFARLYALLDGGVATNSHRFAGVPRLFRSWESMYREAIVHLYRCFLEDEKKKIVGMCLAYPAMIGPDFLRGVRDEEPMALILLLFLTLLFDRMGKLSWWSKRLGVELAIETTKVLLRSDSGLSKLPEFHESIVWANRQLGGKVLTELPWVRRAVELDFREGDERVEEIGIVDNERWAPEIEAIYSPAIAQTKRPFMDMIV